MTDAIQVFVTVDSKRNAEQLATELVEGRLAGCVQVLGPLSSTFRWQGTVERSEEWLLLIKSMRDRYPALEKAIVESHPYDVPEIVALPVVVGSQDYLRWLEQQVITA